MKITPVKTEKDYKNELKKYTNNIIEEDVALETDIVRHDAGKISHILMRL